MRATKQTDAFEARTRTRRNVIAIGTVLAGALLPGCKAEVQTFQDPEINRTSKKPRHVGDSQKPNCFLRGTRILTPLGQQKIEHLKVGDTILTVAGGAKSIRWIGQRSYSINSDENWRDELKPIRIAHGALQPNIPHADLFVSQGHRLYIDGVLLRAADLVNGTSIIVDDCISVEHLDYLHILVDSHNAVLAEGTPAETLLYDADTVRLFDNFPEFEALYGALCAKSHQPFAPVYAQYGRRSQLGSHLRSAISPWFDRRTLLDKARDRWIDPSNQA
jgi:hypothetical protein